jgi:hypothetical protein
VEGNDGSSKAGYLLAGVAIGAMVVIVGVMLAGVREQPRPAAAPPQHVIAGPVIAQPPAVHPVSASAQQMLPVPPGYTLESPAARNIADDAALSAALDTPSPAAPIFIPQASTPTSRTPPAYAPPTYAPPTYAPARTAAAAPASGAKTVYVRGYTKANGTYVAPYTRRAPSR